METKVIKLHGKSYQIVPEITASCDGCDGCIFMQSYKSCDEASARYDCGANEVIFQELNEVQTTSAIKQPVSLNFNLELDFSSSILPTQFKVKSLKLSSLDDALAKGTESYTISTLSLNQEQIQSVAEGLRLEFIRRNTKEVK